MADGNVCRAHAQLLRACQCGPVQMQHRLPQWAAQNLYMLQAQPVDKTGAQGFDGGFLGGEAASKVGDRAFRHGGQFLRGENLFLKPLAKPFTARPDTRKFGDVRSKSDNHSVSIGRIRRGVRGSDIARQREKVYGFSFNETILTRSPL